MDTFKSYVGGLKTIPANMRVVCDDGELMVVKDIVSARSPVFAEFIIEIDGENVARLHGKTCAVMKIIFDYIQWMELPLGLVSIADTLAVYNVALEYKLTSVENVVLNALFNGANDCDMAPKVYLMCDRPSLKNVRISAFEFIKKIILEGRNIYKCTKCPQLLVNVSCKEKRCSLAARPFLAMCKCTQCELYHEPIKCGKIDKDNIVGNVICQGYLDSKISRDINWNGIPNKIVAQIMREICK